MTIAKRFKVRIAVNTVQDYTRIIEADTEDEAADLATQSIGDWDKWEAGDCDTVDINGPEITEVK